MLAIVYPVTLKWQNGWAAHEVRWTFSSIDELAEATKQVEVLLGTLIEEFRKAPLDSITTATEAPDDPAP